MSADRVARALFSLLFGAAGYLLAESLFQHGVLTGPNNLLYLTVLGLLLGFLLSAPAARWFASSWNRLVDSAERVPPDVVIAAGSGATVALLITVLLNNLLAAVPGFTWYWSLLIALLLVTASSWFFVKNRHLLIPVRAGAPSRPLLSPGSRPKVLDTSAVIDGRVAEIANANFLESPLLIPRFVLLELQQIADSDDPLRRKRGRRGLEVLDRLAELPGVATSVIADDPAEVDQVDEKLVQVCLARSADLITTDYNLERVAALEGIRVLNPNQLANAVRVTFLPGERLSLAIVRAGREPGQGLGYLEDGTMVVVEEASDMVGRTVETVVTSSLQTNMGRMIFARVSTNGA